MTTEQGLTLKEFIVLLNENLEEKISVQYVTQEKAVILARDEVEKATKIQQKQIDKIEIIAEHNKEQLIELRTKAVIWGVAVALLASTVSSYIIKIL